MKRQYIYKFKTNDSIEVSIYAETYEIARQELDKVLEDCGRGMVGYMLVSIEEC